MLCKSSEHLLKKLWYTTSRIFTIHHLFLKLPCLFSYAVDFCINKANLCVLQGGKPHVADFVHGSDGLGNTSFPDPTTTNKVEQSAAEFLVDKVSESPGEISVLALGPLTNIALVCNMCFL